MYNSKSTVRKHLGQTTRDSNKNIIPPSELALSSRVSQKLVTSSAAPTEQLPGGQWPAQQSCSICSCNGGLYVILSEYIDRQKDDKHTILDRMIP